MGCGSSSLKSTPGEGGGVSKVSDPSSDNLKHGGVLGGMPIRLGRLSIQGSFNQYESMSEAKKDDTQGHGTVMAGNITVTYAYLTQRGHYPDQPNKANQDAVMVRTDFGKKPDRHLFAVFDGHGETGAECAFFCKSKLPGMILSQGERALESNLEKSVHQALLQVNEELHKSLFDDSLSGTTACVLLLDGTRLVVSNVGDSRAVLATKDENGKLIAVDLSSDQTPFRDDEVERVKACGARVLTLDQMDGLKDPTKKCWTVESECDGDPPRLWVKNGFYPGTAFTRSLGDSLAEKIGVYAEAEHTTHEIQGQKDAFIILATDGVWEFITSQRAVDIVAKHTSMHEAAQELASESYRLWLQNERRTDDITVTILQFTSC